MVVAERGRDLIGVRPVRFGTMAVARSANGLPSLGSLLTAFLIAMLILMIGLLFKTAQLVGARRLSTRFADFD